MPQKYDENNLPFKVKLRRLYKSYKSEVKFKGIVRTLAEDFMPGYYKLNRLYWAIRHRTFNVYHKIDTKLKPGYYHNADRMLHGCFAILEDHINRQFKGVEGLQKYINDLPKWHAEEEKHIPEEHKIDWYKNHLKQVYNFTEMLRLYKWWKEDYPKIEENDPWSIQWEKDYAAMDKSKKPLNDFLNRTSEPASFDEDGDPTSWYHNLRYESPEKEVENKKALDESMEYQLKMHKQIEANFVSLVTIKDCLI